MMSEPDDAAANSGQTSSFETALADLGGLVSKLESGSLGLSDSIAAYERGVSLLHRLHEELAAAEKKVGVLVRIDEEGRPILTPHETATVAEAAATAAVSTRGGARKPRSKTLPGMDDAADAV
ncbi:MAG: exodeoxyribonuclease VII small subunit [Planctomycetia bacterium]|nr:exodeoxyribonuclease VII small subunit [Planctomycetia bacterium]